jgi:NAD-dependent dihydropyrimidine dehydrogenase PreA subunit
MITAINNKTTTVVLSRGQSRNPEKRGLEQAIIDAAQKMEGVDIVVVPHLYDLKKNGDCYQQLARIDGDLVVVSWIFPRAAHWVLDRNGIQGQTGEVLLASDDQQEDPGGQPPSGQPPRGPGAGAAGEEAVDRVTDLYPRPARQIFCIDLKLDADPKRFIAEIERIVDIEDAPHEVSLPIIGGKLVQVDEPTSRRWYPVIDYDRCTNCMECVDFCLFGVYGMDGVENILVEQPDNCRKGCPACSRVCPENAIIFPQHKAPAIAGAETVGDEGFKIDLSQLFGAPTNADDPIAMAARERDEQLLLAGRETVGIDKQLKKRQADLAVGPKDQLDDLIDSLDQLEL